MAGPTPGHRHCEHSEAIQPRAGRRAKEAFLLARYAHADGFVAHSCSKNGVASLAYGCQRRFGLYSHFTHDFLLAADGFCHSRYGHRS